MPSGEQFSAPGGKDALLGKTLGYADVDVTDGSGKLLAHGASTVILLPGKGLNPDPPLPPKFIADD